MFWLLLLLIMLTGWFTPWWFFLVWNFMLGWKMGSFKKSFLVGGLASGLSWVVVAYYRDVYSRGIISTRLSDMFSMPHPFFIYVLLFLIAAIIGSLFCGLGFYLGELRPSRRWAR